MVGVAVASVLAFAATNVDDFVALLLIYAAGGRDRTVIVGQFLGFGAIVLASFVASLGALVVPAAWVGFFGLVPVALGLRDLARGARAAAATAAPPARVSYTVIASITVANGGDNIGLYAPLLARRTPIELVTILAVFGVLVIVWCLSASRVARLPLVARALNRWGHRLSPWIFIALGAYVFVDARAWTVFAHRG